MLGSCRLSCIHLRRVSIAETSTRLRSDLLLMEEGIGLLIPNGISNSSRALLLESCLSSSRLVLYYGVLHNFRNEDQWWSVALASSERVSMVYKYHSEACRSGTSWRRGENQATLTDEACERTDECGVEETRPRSRESGTA